MGKQSLHNCLTFGTSDGHKNLNSMLFWQPLDPNEMLFIQISILFKSIFNKHLIHYSFIQLFDVILNIFSKTFFKLKVNKTIIDLFI
jgi:hypothetical protein